MKSKSGQVRLITAISVIAFGTLASLFLGLGLGLQNSTLSWIGGILMGTMSLAISVLSRWLQ